MQASFAFWITGSKFRKLRYSSTRARSRADHDSWPSALMRLMRSKVLLAAGAGNVSLMSFLSFIIFNVVCGKTFDVAVQAEAIKTGYPTKFRRHFPSGSESLNIILMRNNEVM